MARNTIAIAALAALAVGALATSADAHPKLTSVSPATDVPSKGSPAEIKLNFSEGVILDIKGEGDKAEATVRFPGVGEKILLLAWAPLKKA